MYKKFARPVTDEWYHRKSALKTMLYEIQFYPTGVRERDEILLATFSFIEVIILVCIQG